MKYSVIAPDVVILPIWFAIRSVNQRLPSAPTVIPYGRLFCVSVGNSVIVPLGVMRPIAARSDSLNQRFPSGPATIEYGRVFACGSGNSVTVTCGLGAAAVEAGATRGTASPTDTSIETIHGLNMRASPLRSGRNLPLAGRNA